MKYFYQITFIFCLTIILINCKNKKNYVEIIPSDVDFVVQINAKSIVEKADFKESEKYKTTEFANKKLNCNSPELIDLIENIKNDPKSSGLDIISPIYVFGKKVDNKLFTILMMNMRDKNIYENQLKKIYKSIYQSEIEIESINNYSFISDDNKSLIVWDNNQFFYILGKKETTKTQLKQYFNEITTNKNSLTSNNSFADFISNTKDINIWYTGNFITYFTKNQTKNKNGLDFSKSSWATYLLFNNGNINFTQKFHPDPETKIQLEKRPMWKSKINTDFYKYFPARSYSNFSFAVYPNNTRYIFNNENFITSFLKKHNIDLKTFDTSAEGEVLFSIYDFEQGKSFNVNNYFGKKDSYSKNLINPQFVLGVRMKNKEFYDELVNKLGNSLIKEGHYNIYKTNSNQIIYFAYKYNILYVTNNQIQMNNFILNRIDKFNFIQSEFSNRAKNSMFAYVNLNLDDYPLSVKNHYIKLTPFSSIPKFENFMNQFSKLQYNVTDEYSKNGSIILKKSDGNSLEIILEFLINNYSEIFNTKDNLVK